MENRVIFINHMNKRVIGMICYKLVQYEYKITDKIQKQY